MVEIITFLIAVAETTPAIDPETVLKIVNVIITITAGQPWGIWVYLGFAVIGLLATIARFIVQHTDGERDDQFFIKWFGWIPTITTAKTANKVVGKGALDASKLQKIWDKFKH